MDSERLVKAKARLTAYYDAELAVLSGQSYTMGSRSLTRADLAEIRKAISELERQVDELTNKINNKGRRRAYRITPRDI